MPSSSKTAFTIAGVNSLDDRPYRPADDSRLGVEWRTAFRVRFGERGDHVQIERVANRARFLRAIEHGHGADSRRQRRQKRRPDERAEEADLHHADLVSLSVQMIHGLVHRVGTRSHDHDHALGGGIADVVEEAVAAPGQLAEPLHRALDGARTGVVKRIRCLARLKEDVRVLGGSAEDRTIRRQPAVTVRVDQWLRNQRAQVLVCQLFDLRDLVRRPEAVEEVQERNARLECCRMRDRGHVVRFLHGVRAQQREACLPAGHHVGVVAEDRQRVRGERPRRHVHRERGELARDLVHVGNHQQQALGRRKGRRQ